MDTAKKISKNREKKQHIVAELSHKVKKAKAMVFANYQGMTHKQLEELKKSLRTVEAELAVTKNTLLERSLTENNISIDHEFSGPTLTLFAYNDIILPLKELAKTIKLFNLPLVTLGILDGKLVSDKDVLKLSTLPSREVLLSQLVFQMKSPLYGFHRALNWNLQKLVLTLKSIEKTKQ